MRDLETLSFKQSITRIYSTGGQAVGAGIFTSQNRVLTCAHVVRSALGLLDEQRDQVQLGQTTISLSFPFNKQPTSVVAASSVTTFLEATVTLCDWNRDIAVVTLPSEFEQNGQPHPFTPLDENGTMPEVWKHDFRACGFPLGESKGAWATGILLDANDDGTIQLESIRTTGKAVERGFSGTPVWDDELHGIVGLMVQAADDKDERVAYMIPVSLLVEIVPDLPTAPTRADEAFYAQQKQLRLAEAELAKRMEEVLEDKFVQLTLMKSQGKGKYAAPSAEASDRYEDLQELIESCQEPVLMLLGAPGSGKSVLLEQLCLQTVQDGIGEPEGQLPFFVRLNRYQGDSLTPLKWLTAEWNDRYWEIAPELPFEKMLRQNRLLLLLDGLNEIPHDSQAEYEAKSRQWSDFLDRRLKENQALFTCRTLDYSTGFDKACKQVSIQQVQVEPLSETKIHEFLKRFKPDLSDAAWEQIKESQRLIDLYAIPFFLKLLIDQVGEDGKVPKGRATLITGYVWDALNRELVPPKNPILSRLGLLSDYDQELILDEAWDAASFELPLEGALMRALIDLAYTMQAGMGRDGGLVSLKKPEAGQLLQDYNADEVIEAGIQLNLLTQERVKQEAGSKQEAGIYLRFAHQLFQEYFAAQRLKNAPEPERVRVEHRAQFVAPKTYIEEISELDAELPVSALPTTGWEETMILAAGMVEDTDGLIRELMLLNLPLAGRCALSSEVALSDGLKLELTQALLNRITDEEYDVRSRVSAGLVLGELGDPRFEDHGDFLLPPFVQISGGVYQIGDDNGLSTNEKPANEIELEPFEVAVYPVTNGEYKKFVMAGGYEDEQWWDTPAAVAWLRGNSTAESGRLTWRSHRKLFKGISEVHIRSILATKEDKERWIAVRNSSDDEFEGWLEKTFPIGITYREPSEWKNFRFNGPNQPVVGITWFEAHAYCKWLSNMSRQIIDLPSEAEWEAATRFNQLGSYPYGTDYIINGGNTVETHLFRPIPVGVFSAGITLNGLHDISGNIYEMTNSLWGKELDRPKYKYPYNKRLNERENLEAEDNIYRVIRGGSWRLTQREARSSYRGRSSPTSRNNDMGFRLINRFPSHPIKSGIGPTQLI